MRSSSGHGVRRLNEAGKPVAAICSGPLALLRAGILQSRPYTVAFQEEQRDFLGFPPATYRSENVVRDGNLLTASGNGYAEFVVQMGDVFGIFRDEGHERRVRRFYLEGRAD